MYNDPLFKLLIIAITILVVPILILPYLLWAVIRREPLFLLNIVTPRRHIVDVLTNNNIKASRFVGQAKKDGDVGMKQEEQAQVLEAFRTGKFSGLVATSIAEEGLDIPEVDLVIFYEPIPSEIRYIQRRGRTGRRSSGSVIILAAKDSIDERHLNASKRRIEKMNQILDTIKSVLKSINRTTSPTPILDLMTNEEISAMEVSRAELEVKMEKAIEIQTASTLTKEVPKWIPLLDRGYTKQFVRDANTAARKIHSLLVKKKGILERMSISLETHWVSITTFWLKR